MRRFRVPLALLLGLCAAASALLATESSNAQTTTAVRLVSAVPAGEVLTEQLLEELETDAAAVPQGHSGDLDDYLGETLAAALPAGAVVHPSQLVGPGLLEGHPAGTVAIPVRPADTALISLLTPGQRVDVLATSDSPESTGGTQRIAHDVPVLWIPQDPAENWLGGGGDSQLVVILAVDTNTAEAIADATYQGRIHLSLVGE